MLEVDTRPIEGNGGSVTLAVVDDRSLAAYSVVVRSGDGTQVADLRYCTRAAAVRGYRHPFVDPTVPDLFARVPASL